MKLSSSMAIPRSSPPYRGAKVALGLLLIAWMGFLRFPDPSEAPTRPMWFLTAPVDGKSYVGGAVRMENRGEYLYTSDGKHSVGMQLVCRLMVACFGKHSAYPFQVLNTLTLLGTAIILFFWVWERTGRFAVAVVGGLSVGASRTLWEFATFVQYELLAGFVILLTLYLLRNARSPGPMLTAGILTAALGIVRIHFNGLLFFVLAFAWFRFGWREGRRHAAAVLAGWLLLAAPFNLYYSLRSETWFFFQSNATYKTLIRNNNPRSTGVNFPYAPDGGPSGLAFVRKAPRSYLRLLGRRTEFLLGLRAHRNMVESYPAQYFGRFSRPKRLFWRGFVVFATGALFLLGLFGLWRRGRGAEAWLCLGPAAVMCFLTLFINSAQRFLVPAYPTIFLAAVLGFHYLGGVLVNYVTGLAGAVNRWARQVVPRIRSRIVGRPEARSATK